MKRILIITLSLALLISFAACGKEKDKPTTTTAASTTAEAAKVSETTSETSTKEKESTTAKKAGDISFIYNGYWYMNEGNKVTVLKFEPSGSVTVNTFRRKNIASADNAPDSVIYGSFKDLKNGSISVCPDNESPDEVYTCTVGTDGTLSMVNDDPEGESTLQLQNFNTLSKDNARRMMLGEN